MADFLILDDNKNKTEENNKVVDNNKSTSSFIDKLNNFILTLQKIKTKEKVIFYRLLSTMTNAGMTLVKSVAVLEAQEKNPVFKKVLGRLCEELKEGNNLSDSLDLYPDSFSEAEIGIVKSGETTGQLNQVLTDLANQIEKVESLNGKIKSAMIYPFFILLVVVGVVSIMMIKVVPNLLNIFDDKSALPETTKLLISISDAFRDYWAVFIIVFFIFFIFVSVWKKTPDGKYLFDKMLLYIPIFGEINRKLILSKFSRVFAGLVGSGVSVVESLNITAQAVGNEVYKQRILLVAEDISVGIRMWESLDGDKLFPEMMIQMIQVGEQTAKLDKTILKVADFYDEEVDNMIRILNKLLEPFIIVTLAVIVGFIALAIIQPIMGLAESVSG